MFRDQTMNEHIDTRLSLDGFCASRSYMNLLSNSNKSCKQNCERCIPSYPKAELLNNITIISNIKASQGQCCSLTNHGFAKDVTKNIDQQELMNTNINTNHEIKDANNSSSNVADCRHDFNKCMSEKNTQNNASTSYLPNMAALNDISCSNIPSFSIGQNSALPNNTYCLPSNTAAPLSYMQNLYSSNYLLTESPLIGGTSVLIPNLGAILNRYRTRRAVANNDSAYKKCSMDVVQYIYSNFLDQTSCDVIIRTRDGDVMSHQLILGAYSPTIDTFLKNSKRCLQNTLLIKVQDCSLEAVADCLNFLYTTDILLNCLNIGFITDVATQLDFTLLSRLCNDYLVQTVEVDNAFLHLSVALNNNFIGAIEILKFIAMNFYDLIEHEHLMILPYDKFVTIITHPMLAAKEIEVFRAVVNWVNCNRPGRIQHAKSLLGMVRFNLIDPGELVSDVEMQDWIFTDSNCKNIILEAYKYHALNTSKVRTSAKS